MILYHYTTLDAMTTIVKEQRLKPSLRRNRPRDVRYGDGQYMTDLQPGILDGQDLSRLLVGHPDEDHRFTHFLAIEVSGLEVIRGRSRIFVVRGGKDLDLTGRIVTTGSNADDLS